MTNAVNEVTRRQATRGAQSYSLNLLIVLLSVASSLAAQQMKVLNGTVHDPLGLSVAGAEVDLLQDGKVVATCQTGTDGSFHFDASGVHRYRIRVSAATFQTTTTSAMYVAGSGLENVDVTLATKTLTQQITVTATGTPIPEAQVGASIRVIPAGDFAYMPNIQDPLRLIPGLQVTQVGQMGATTGLRIRGGGTDANKVLIDGVPANSIGGAVEFASLASVGVDSIEVLREPNSALYGSDALAGVVSLRSTRGTTSTPLFTYAGDAGNFHTYRNEVTAGTVFRQFDLYSAFARIDTDNDIPNSAFHNATYAGNFGWAPNAKNDLRFTVRHIIVSAGQPNAIAFYGIPDDSQQKEQDNYYNVTWNNQTTARWHNEVRYGGLRLNGEINDFGAVGIPDGYGDTLGAPVTIRGANGYAVSGQALFYYAGTTFLPYLEDTKRDFVYAQTDYRFSSHLLALGGFKYENESGLSGYKGSTPTSVQRGNYSYTLQLAGDLKNRFFYNLGSGLEDNGLFGFAATPRASLAYYVSRPSPNHFLSGTKVHGSFGKGIKEPSIFQQANSLYATLASLSNGTQLISQYHVSPVGAVNSRTYDAGLDQQLLDGRALVGVTYFHNEFTNGVEYVPQQGLLDLGVAAANLPAFAYGAYLNSSAYRAQGAELEVEYKINSRLFARGGYTYTNAVVQRSFSSDNLYPTYNTAFSFGTIQIGAYSPLVGARPFRIAPHTGYFSLNYTHSKLYALLTGTLVSKRDDSDFLTDQYFGNNLLLPNRNLDGSYARLDLGGGYQVTPRISIYANIQNLLSEHYEEAIGFPAMPFTFRSGIRFTLGGEGSPLKK